MTEDDFDELDDLDEDEPEELPLCYSSGVDWVEQWLAPTIAMRLGKERRWCRQWFRHPEVAIRLMTLWKAWEEARAEGAAHSAMSAWFINHLDPQMRTITAEAGPLYLCDKDRHTPTPTLPVIAAPPHFFDAPTEGDEST